MTSGRMYEPVPRLSFVASDDALPQIKELHRIVDEQKQRAEAAESRQLATANQLAKVQGELVSPSECSMHVCESACVTLSSFAFRLP